MKSRVLVSQKFNNMPLFPFVMTIFRGNKSISSISDLTLLIIQRELRFVWVCLINSGMPLNEKMLTPVI